MQDSSRIVLACFALAALGLAAQEAPKQDAPKKEGAVDAKPIPPRATPADYQAHADAGDIKIGAEFAQHSVPTPDALLSTEDYVVVEVGVFGPPDTRLKLSYEDFSLRINGKKNATPATAYTLVFKSLKDPNWEPPTPPTKPGGTSISSGGRGGQADGGLPPVVHIPLPLERAMAQRVQKAALPEGEHVLPQAGLLFFSHRGKVQSIELIYSGPAGKASMTLAP